VNLKMLLRPVPQKFNTFNTFNIFAKFAKFANFNPALDHPTLLHRHAPRLGSISEHAVSWPNPPLLSLTGEGGRGVRALCSFLPRLLFRKRQQLGCACDDLS
jgi:hypothetical protein